MSKKYDYAVIIGRFQPVHKGHAPTFDKALEMADNVICVIGSSNMPRTIKNPFTAGERKDMILRSLETSNFNPETQTISFVEVEDTLYQDQEWIRQVKNKVKDVAKLSVNIEQIEADIVEHNGELLSVNEAAMQLHLGGNRSEYGQLLQQYLDYHDGKIKSSICILGHEKDNSSYYLKNFSNWDLVDTGAWVGDFKHDIPVSATHIRELWFEGKLGYAVGNLLPSTIEYMNEWVEDNEDVFIDLKEEYDYIKDYKAQTQSGPFPVQFLTTDAVVVQGDEVLLIRRGANPGKGLWALPGGFANPEESLFDSAVRELREETRIAVPEKVLRGSVKEEKVFDHPERSLRGRTISMAYLFVLDPSQPRPRVKGADDAVAAWWFPIDELYKMRDELFEDHYDIIRYLTSRI